MCLLYKIYYRANHSLHEYLHTFIAACNTIGLVALCELALVIPRCRTDSLLPVVCTRNFPPPDVFSGGTFSSFKNAMNLCLQRSKLYFSLYFDLFLLFISLPGIIVQRPV